MKKLVALSLVIALSFLVLAPMPVEAGASTDAALALGAFAVLNQLLRGETIFHPRERVIVVEPSYPVYGPQPINAPQPIHAPAPVIMYRSPICVGQLTVEYGWRNHPMGGPPEYVPTGRTFCNGQILY